MQMTLWLLRLLLSIPIVAAGLLLALSGPLLYLEEIRKIESYQILKDRSHYVTPELDWKYTWVEENGIPVYQLTYSYLVAGREFRGESQTRHLPVWDQARLYYLPGNPEISSLDPLLSYQDLKSSKYPLLIVVLLFTLTFVALMLLTLIRVWFPSNTKGDIEPI